MEDEREGEVADVARRAALAASARQKLSRESGVLVGAEDVDSEMLERLGTALERIEANCTNFAGAMLFRGPNAAPIISLLPDFGAEEARRTLTRAATAVRMQFELLADTSIGGYVNSIISTGRGALLVQALGEDLLLVNLAGSPPDVGPAWRAVASERDEIAEAAAELFG